MQGVGLEYGPDKLCIRVACEDVESLPVLDIYRYVYERHCDSKLPLIHKIGLMCNEPGITFRTKDEGVAMLERLGVPIPVDKGGDNVATGSIIKAIIGAVAVLVFIASFVWACKIYNKREVSYEVRVARALAVCCGCQLLFMVLAIVAAAISQGTPPTDAA
eukprot:gene18865-58525_t